MSLKIPKPVDRFAEDFLRFLKTKAPGQWAMDDCVIKVLYCKDSLWNDLRTVYGGVVTGNPDEYTDRPDTSTAEGWGKVNAVYLLPSRLENGRPKVAKLSAYERRSLLERAGITGSLADQLSGFDALVFVNAAAVVRRAKAGIPFPDLQLVAHEVVHISERLSGGRPRISKWDPRLVESPLNT